MQNNLQLQWFNYSLEIRQTPHECKTIYNCSGSITALKSDKPHMNAEQSTIAVVQLQPKPNTTGQKDTSSAFVLIFLSQSGVVIGTPKVDISPSSKLLAV
jgi:hypothetical protein